MLAAVFLSPNRTRTPFNFSFYLFTFLPFSSFVKVPSKHAEFVFVFFFALFVALASERASTKI